MSTTLNSGVLPAHLKGRDFLTFLEYSPEEMHELLNLAVHLKAMKRSRTPHKLLEGRSVALYFE